MCGCYVIARVFLFMLFHAKVVAILLESYRWLLGSCHAASKTFKVGLVCYVVASKFCAIWSVFTVLCGC